MLTIFGKRRSIMRCITLSDNVGGQRSHLGYRVRLRLVEVHLIVEQIVPNVIVIASPGARTFARI